MKKIKDLWAYLVYFFTPPVRAWTSPDSFIFFTQPEERARARQLRILYQEEQEREAICKKFARLFP